MLPLPIHDPERPWGQSNCDTCKGSCYGHYLKPDETLNSNLMPVVPPSTYIKERFDKLVEYPPSAAECEDVARSVLLSPDEVSIWFDHLHTVSENRKRGAARAAVTRQRKRQTKKQAKEAVCCCGVAYQEVTESVEDWICCDKCDSWFHFGCAGIDPTFIPQNFLCQGCQ